MYLNALHFRAFIESNLKPWTGRNPEISKSLRFLPPDKVAGLARSAVRGNEIYLLALAACVGFFTALLVFAMREAAEAMHVSLFGPRAAGGLSAARGLPSLSSAVPALGGLIYAAVNLGLAKWGRSLVDAVEANALHGGRIAARGSAVIVSQTVMSNGIGASVGLEAAYTQVGALVGSKVGQLFHLRRQDLRLFVGCGASAAIAAAFGAPVTGAFYAFEIVVGTYTVGAVAPVLAAALTATFTLHWLGAAAVPLHADVSGAVPVGAYPAILAIAVASGGVGIALIRSVSAVEFLISALAIPVFMRPALGGLLLGLLALVSPVALSSGHAALHIELAEAGTGLRTLLMLFLLKAGASAVSLGCGFRGGLFFASLLLGALFGKLVVGTAAVLCPFCSMEPSVAAMIGMTGLAVSIVGGPLTMAFLAVETTGDLGLAAAVLLTAIVSGTIVRVFFGYSFSTWRLHLRGETIRSAHDVGWLRHLTVGKMMRPVKPARSDLPLDEFRRRHPLGSSSSVVLVDEAGDYAGIVSLSDVHSQSANDPARSLTDFVELPHVKLTPGMNAREAIGLFELSESEMLAVVEGQHSDAVVGVMTEAHTFRRYTEEMEAAQRGILEQRSMR